jgi:hypothetical protein
MASALVSNRVMPGADVNRPRLQVAFNRLPAAPEMEREWWYEPEFPGVYRLVSVNGKRPPYYWAVRSDAGLELEEWLISGRAFLREDRGWVLRLASGARPGSGESHLTVMEGTWAPAMTGQLAVRMSNGSAASWLANGRSILMRGYVVPPGTPAEATEVTFRFTRWR